LDTAITSIEQKFYQKMNTAITSLEQKLVASLTDAIKSSIADSLKTLDAHATSMSKMEERLNAKIDNFNGQFGDLRTDAIDHERRLKDHERRLNDLNSNMLKLESVHKGYKANNNDTVATLRTDVNDTRAKIPEFIERSRTPLLHSAKNTRTLRPASRHPSKKSRTSSMAHALSSRYRTPVTQQHLPTRLSGAHRSTLHQPLRTLTMGPETPEMTLRDLI
jgi:chromosome segregation ATPase